LRIRFNEVIKPLEAELSAYAEAEEGSRLAHEALAVEHRRNRNARIVLGVTVGAATVFLISAIWWPFASRFLYSSVGPLVLVYAYVFGIPGILFLSLRPGYRRQIGRNITAQVRLENTRALTLDLLTIEICATIRQLPRRKPPSGASSVTLDVAEAPDLVETDTRDVIPSASVREIGNFIDRHGTSAVGLAGPRGVGKTTIIRKAIGQLERLGVYIQAPVHYNAADFVRLIHAEAAHAILRENGIFEESISHEAPRAFVRRRNLLTFGITAVGIASVLISFQGSVPLLSGLTPLRVTGFSLILVQGSGVLSL